VTSSIAARANFYKLERNLRSLLQAKSKVLPAASRGVPPRPSWQAFLPLAEEPTMACRRATDFERVRGGGRSRYRTGLIVANSLLTGKSGCQAWTVTAMEQGISNQEQGVFTEEQGKISLLGCSGYVCTIRTNMPSVGQWTSYSD
jgi:hypothetical protein